jgi:hypothetical protein
VAADIGAFMNSEPLRFWATTEDTEVTERQARQLGTDRRLLGEPPAMTS